MQPRFQSGMWKVKTVAHEQRGSDFRLGAPGGMIPMTWLSRRMALLKATGQQPTNFTAGQRRGPSLSRVMWHFLLSGPVPMRPCQALET